MEHFKTDFTSRQYMVTPDFEFFHYRDASTIEVEYHNHDFYEVYFFLSGDVTYVIEGISYKLNKNDIVLVDNKQLHKPVITSDKPYERIVIWVNPDFLNQHSDKNTDLSLCFKSLTQRTGNLFRFESSESHNEILRILSDFEYACNSMSFGGSILKKILLLELIIHINKAFISMFNTNNDILGEYNSKINDILGYINNNLDKDLSLDNLSAMFYTSKYHLLREFKKFTGYTIHKYIKQKRLIKAKSLLRQGATITDTCHLCGFSDYSNFIRSFKSTYGLSPGKFRNI